MKNCSEKIAPMSEYMDAVLTQFRKMEELAYVSAYGKGSEPKITRHLRLASGDGCGAIYRKYARAAVLMSDLLHQMGCWKKYCLYRVKLNLGRLQEVLDQIPDLADTDIEFHTKMVTDPENPEYQCTLSAFTLYAKGYDLCFHEHGAFNITVPYELRTDPIVNNKKNIDIITSVVGSGRWRL